MEAIPGKDQIKVLPSHLNQSVKLDKALVINTVSVPYNNKGLFLAHDMSVALFHILCYSKLKE